VLANIVGKPPEQIFSEFLGPLDPQTYTGRGDVKYHMGYSHDWSTRAGQKLHISLAFNPSHLGVVHPVVTGRVRAKQDRAGARGRHTIVPLVIHGDAAFAAQGLVAETLNLGGLPGYTVGGTVHVVVNNQIGYTTLADQGRTPLYCTGQAQMLDIPIFHVNGDDAEACVHVMRLAAEYRQTFGTDVVIDLVCYRKYGHNEGDEPAFTQPKMYERIRRHPTPRAVYAQKLADAGRVSLAESQAMLDEAMARFSAAHAKAKQGAKIDEPSTMQAVWTNYRAGADKDVPQVDTGVDAGTLRTLLGKLGATPEGFTLHPGVQRVLDARRLMADGTENLNWGAAEMLAYATLVHEGHRVRVTGQDTERGTFAHRHAVLHDTRTGDSFDVLGALSTEKGRGEVINSPLSEAGCLGFEFGYSLDRPDGLVVWEAQFGDFANNAQVIIDQFIAGCEDKWNRFSGLTLLLPHGYEGAGPEHSSARLERFLELAAEDNLQVCYPTSSAQVFHLLRRQVHRPIRKPLVVMTPKSLLRLEAAASPLAELTQGRFLRLIDEAGADPSKVKRLLLCSGKVFFDLKKARDAAADSSIAIARLEQLYPLPEDELNATFRRYTRLNEVYWVQEEPRNMGAWRALLEPLQVLCAAHLGRPSLTYVGRAESAAPATGFLKAHEYEQRQLVNDSIARNSNVR
jgi:2-oxoglutarate dehydrogenase E1 component